MVFRSKNRPKLWMTLGLVFAAGFVIYLVTQTSLFSEPYTVDEANQSSIGPKPTLDKFDYDTRLLALAHVATSSPWYRFFLTGTTSPSLASGSASSTINISLLKQSWPVKTVYPEYGAILPFNRVVAFYGNFYSKQMGVLGEYSEDVVLQKLASTTAEWQAADPATPVIPAINYIAVTAQAAAGKDGMYRARMPDSQIEKALAMAEKIKGLVILDVQVGKSTLEQEVPALEAFLKLPNVELAIDPEFSMKGSASPGMIIGHFKAEDINFTVDFLSRIVRENNLPPKILVIHRFTEDMVKDYQSITPSPEVQIVMDMDGWGFPEKKILTYNAVVASEPVQFTGFKIFFHNDVRPPSTRLITPREVLRLTPSPIFIQYQ